ncbi:response regulator [Flavihumibacter petaseus]|uniref:Putative two-component response regulator n=1 Tax=Flavihumibacter petaseus NBRC 106054 TaxID=1220578 RepID=A0A0E9MUD0_9BACT|nr:response regulator transcription factor [Flavihumibacter petaseus]GAO41088.1 putative two-component response regulator [Flavihumibacter petaseus NBRC 106054]
MATSILIADDHSIVRSGVKALIKQHIDQAQVEEASDENEITEKIRSRSFRLLVLDINIPGSDFTNLMEWLRHVAPETGILIFSTYNEDIYGKKCLQMGARGYLRKTAANAEILEAIRTVLEGGYYISGQLQALLQENGDEQPEVSPLGKLSAKELEIALLIQKGHSLPEICNLLKIQYSTANTYKRRVFEKLKVHNGVGLSQLMKTFHIE